MRKIKIGSDFSGVGAFDYAIQRVAQKKDFTTETIYACDWDKYARITYAHNHGEPSYYPKDVYEREIPKDSLDIYMTSPPCQAFSLAGKRLGKDDKRGILFFNSHEFIQENKPRFFIFENVKGLLSDDGGKTFQEWINMLGGKSVNGVPILFPYEDSVPYHLYWKVLNAKHHGVPQNRERVFIIGIRDDQDNKFSWPVEEHLSMKLKDVLEEEVFEKYILSDKLVNRLKNADRAGEFTDADKKDISNCIIVGYHKLPTDGEYIVVKSSLEKYYLSQKMLDGFAKHNEHHEEKGTGFIFSPKEEDDIANCLRANASICATDNTLKVGTWNDFKDENGAKKGFKQLEDGVCPTILARAREDGSGQPVVMVSKEVRTEESKKKRKETGTNDFRGKEIEFREQDVSNTITTSLTNDHLLKQDYKIRRLTPLEAFRLMDFPDELIITNNLVKDINKQGIIVSLKKNILCQNVKEKIAIEKQKQSECVLCTIKDSENMGMKTLFSSIPIEEIANVPSKIVINQSTQEDFVSVITTHQESMVILLKPNTEQKQGKIIQTKEFLNLMENQDLESMENPHIELFLKITLEDCFQKMSAYTTLTVIQTIMKSLTYFYSNQKVNTLFVMLNYKKSSDKFFLNLSDKEQLCLKMENIKPISDSMLYKQAGNSIVVRVLEKILDKLPL